jgi:putative addiction module component (TIGR02574 family)
LAILDDFWGILLGKTYFCLRKLSFSRKTIIMSELIAEISKLSVAHRIELVQEILRTIALETSEDETLTQAQIALIETRAAKIASGMVKTVSWEDIQLKFTERYGLQN